MYTCIYMLMANSFYKQETVFAAWVSKVGRDKRQGTAIIVHRDFRRGYRYQYVGIGFGEGIGGSVDRWIDGSGHRPRVAVDSSGWMGRKDIAEPRWLLWMGFLPFIIRGEALFHVSGFSDAVPNNPPREAPETPIPRVWKFRLASFIYPSGYKIVSQPACGYLPPIHHQCRNSILTRIPLGVILARTFSIGANPGAYVLASDHGGGVPSARCYPPSARVSVRRPRDDMHRARRPFIRMSVDFEVAHHGPETCEHETV